MRFFVNMTTEELEVCQTCKTLVYNNGTGLLDIDSTNHADTDYPHKCRRKIHGNGVVELYPPFGGHTTPVTCGACGRTWDDSVVTGCTPAPSGRCPFESDHPEPDEREKRRAAARERLYQGYAIHFALDYVMDCYQPNDGEPTDENLALVLAGSARRPDPAWFPMIREYVYKYRRGDLQL